jgi:hypothetical protein
MQLDYTEVYLDYCITLSTKPATKLAQYSEKFSVSGHIGAFIEDGSINLIYYFPLRVSETREGSIFLQEFNAEKNGDMWTIERTVDEGTQKFAEACLKIIRMKSSVLDIIMLQNGTFYVNIIFNHSILPNVSDVILNEISHLNAKIEYFGPRNVDSTVIGLLKNLMPLSYVMLSVRPPVETSQEINKLLGNKWFKRLKMPLSLMDLSGFVVKDNGVSVQEIKDPVPDDHAFETTYATKIIKEILNGCVKEKIVATGITEMMDHDVISMEFYLPEFMINPFIGIVSKVSESNPLWNLSLSSVKSGTKAS